MFAEFFQEKIIRLTVMRRYVERLRVNARSIVGRINYYINVLYLLYVLIDLSYLFLFSL